MMIKVIEKFLQPNSIKVNDLAHHETNRQLETLKKSLFNTPLSDETKVEQLKKELSSGEYEIQSQSLASKLLEHLLFLDKCELA